MYLAVYSCRTYKAVIALLQGLEPRLDPGDEIKVIVSAAHMSDPYEVAYYSLNEMPAAAIPDVTQVSKGRV